MTTCFLGVISLARELHNKESVKGLSLLLFILGPIHTMPVKIEKAALFLRLGLPSALIWTEIVHRK